MIFDSPGGARPFVPPRGRRHRRACLAFASDPQSRAIDPFLHAVRQHLYRTNHGRPPTRSSLAAVVDLLSRGAREQRIAAVVTPRHFQLQRRYRLTDEERAAARAKLESSARGGRPNAQIDALLNATLRQAETHERIVSESLGVKTIWLDDFDDIPDVLGAIAK